MSYLSTKWSKLIVVGGGVLSLLLVLVWSHFVSRYFEYSAEIIRLQPIMSRLVGMRDSEQFFKEADQQVRASLAELSLSVQGDADAAAAELQRKVRSLAAEHEMSVSGSQILPPQEGEGYQQIGINMTIKGPMYSVPAMLGDLNVMQPRVVVSSAQLSPSRSRRGAAQNVSLRISVLVLRTK